MTHTGVYLRVKAAYDRAPGNRRHDLRAILRAVLRSEQRFFKEKRSASGIGRLRAAYRRRNR